MLKTNENNTVAHVSAEQMKPYMVSMDELKSFDNDEMAPIKETISREINNISIDFSIPGRIELELKYFDKIVSKGIEVIDCLNDAVLDCSSSSVDDDMKSLLSTICSGVKDILVSFSEYKKTLEGGDPTEVETVFKAAFAKALIREVDLVKLAPYADPENIEELMSSTLDQIKICFMNNEFDVEKASNAYEQLIDQFDQIEQLISNDFESFVDMVA
jgi:hypothetical protein